MKSHKPKSGQYVSIICICVFSQHYKFRLRAQTSMSCDETNLPQHEIRQTLDTRCSYQDIERRATSFSDHKLGFYVRFIDGYIPFAPALIVYKINADRGATYEDVSIASCTASWTASDISCREAYGMHRFNMALTLCDLIFFEVQIKKAYRLLCFVASSAFCAAASTLGGNISTFPMTFRRTPYWSSSSLIFYCKWTYQGRRHKLTLDCTAQASFSPQGPWERWLHPLSVWSFLSRKRTRWHI